MRSIPFGLALYLITTPLHLLAQQGGVAAGTATFLTNNPGARAMYQGEKLVALYGPAFANDSNVATTTDNFVDTFLADPGSRSALGVDDLVLVPKESHVIRNGTMKVYRYAQEIEGLPVYGSLVTIPVHLPTTEWIGYIGIRLSQTPANALPGDVLDGVQAIAAVSASQQYGHITTFGTATKMIYERGNGTLHRTWSFSGTGGWESYLFFVDTNSGEILAAISQVFDADVSGVVSGYATPCCPPTDPGWPACCGALAAAQLTELEGVRVKVVAGGVPACPDSTGTVVTHQSTDSGGGYELTGFTVPARVTPGLDGDLVTVLNCEGLAIAACLPVLVEGSLEHLYDCAGLNAEYTEANFILNSSPAEFDVAQVTVHEYVRKTHDWFADLQPGFNGINKNLRCGTNVLNWNNAGYRRTEEVLAFGAGDGVTLNNFAMPMVIAHEYGHFILDQALEVPSGPIHEGIADVVSTFLNDTPYVGYDLRINQTPGFLRRVDEPDVRFGNCGSQPSWCSSCDANHCQGLALGGAFWDLRKSIGANDAERIFADFLFVTDGSESGELDASVVAEVLVADEDDDGDITNGTKHSAAICTAFTNHGWTCPGPGVDDNSIVVNWLPPTTTGPDKGTDYFVHFEFDPPHVTLASTVHGGVPITDWFVGRVESQITEECPNPPCPLDLGRVSADWVIPPSGTPRDISVRVGDATEATRKVKNVNIIDIPSQSASNWSNIRLELSNGSLLGRAQCFANSSNAGGRISGSVTYGARRVLAHAVGLGGSDAGTLAARGETSFRACSPFSCGESDREVGSPWYCVSRHADAAIVDPQCS